MQHLVHLHHLLYVASGARTDRRGTVRALQHPI